MHGPSSPPRARPSRTCTRRRRGGALAATVTAIDCCRPDEREGDRRLFREQREREASAKCRARSTRDAPGAVPQEAEPRRQREDRQQRVVAPGDPRDGRREGGMDREDDAESDRDRGGDEAAKHEGEQDAGDRVERDVGQVVSSRPQHRSTARRARTTPSRAAGSTRGRDRRRACTNGRTPGRGSPGRRGRRGRRRRDRGRRGP